MTKKTLIICGEHDREAPRYRNIRKEIEEEFSVKECHASEGKLIPTIGALLKKLTPMIENADVVLVTFPGQYLVPFVWLKTRRPRKKLIFDAFISLYDTNVSDRKKVSPWNPYAWFLFVVDWMSCHLADEILVDTNAQKEFFTKRYKVKPDRIRVIYLGTREDLFFPKESKPHEGCQVLFYGTYIPLQGIEFILDAAKILQDSHPDVHFTLVGSGQTKKQMLAHARELQLSNVTFKDPVEYKVLPDLIRGADLCLGIFGTSKKANRVIPHKVYDAVACGIPVLTADTDGIREQFAKNPNVLVCQAGDGRAIADSVAKFCKRSGK